MKGQFVFEFIIAGVIFFAVVLYTINYLSFNVSDFSSRFYQNRMQSKAIQIAEILMSGESGFSMADNLRFNLTKIQRFNSTYCGDLNYGKFVRDFYLYENTVYGISPNNARVGLFTRSSVILDCGPRMPRNTTKADIERVGLYQGEMAKLRVTIW